MGPGSASRIDVSGDTNLGNLEAGFRPIHAALIPNASKFYIANFGQDDHNLKVARHQIGHGFSGRIPAGGRAKFIVTLKPGTYNLYCTIPGHRAMGMLRKLVVT